MSSTPPDRPAAGRQRLGSWLTRGAGYYAFWVLLIGFKPADLLVGLVAAAAATWTSLALLPPGELRWHPAALPRYAMRFLWMSVIAGWDVMRRAFSLSLPLRPGMISYPPRCPQGAGRNAFASLTSLLPGTVPVRDDAQGLLYHCLDIDQPIVEQLAMEETAFSRVLPQEPGP